MHSVQDGQADRREGTAGDIMDHIAAFFGAHRGADGCGIRNTQPPCLRSLGGGFFLGAAPETSLSVCWRGSMNCGCASICGASVCLAQILSAALETVVRGMSGRDTRCRACRRRSGADFIRTRAAPLARRAGGIGGAERNRKNSLTFRWPVRKSSEARVHVAGEPRESRTLR